MDVSLGKEPTKLKPNNDEHTDFRGMFQRCLLTDLLHLMYLRLSNRQIKCPKISLHHVMPDKEKKWMEKLQREQPLQWDHKAMPLLHLMGQRYFSTC